jgi:hypothetical protein
MLSRTTEYAMDKIIDDFKKWAENQGARNVLEAIALLSDDEVAQEMSAEEDEMADEITGLLMKTLKW